jgi:DNA-binding HxlR family transcriptional regulator
LLRKADELNGRLRQFFERLKTQLEGSPGSFFAKDIRQSLRIHPQSLHRNLRQLEKLGLVQQVGYNRKTGFEYEITIWDDYEKLKDGINILDRILQELRDKEQGNQGGENEGNQDAA